VPEAMEKALKKEAKKKGLVGEKADHYVYGAMVNRGWKPGKKPR
jgi:hypothetical protein